MNEVAIPAFDHGDIFGERKTRLMDDSYCPWWNEAIPPTLIHRDNIHDDDDDRTNLVLFPNFLDVAKQAPRTALYGSVMCSVDYCIGLVAADDELCPRQEN